MRNGFCHLLVAVTVTLSVLVSAPVAAQPTAMPDSRPRENDAQLRHALEGLQLRHRVPGLAAAIFDHEQIRAFGVGELTPGGNPVTPDSRFRIGQASTLLVGLATAAMIADGSLSEDSELSQLAPEVDLHNPWSTERPIRLEDLLAHRAGLGATHFRDVFAESEGQPLLAGINRAFRALRIQHRPGEREQYSVVGPAIAAYVVEKTAGMPYEDVLSRMLFRPLELHATLGRVGGARSGDSAGHAGWPARKINSRPLNLPAGDAWISARDFARIGQLLLNRGTSDTGAVLAAEAVEWLESAPNGALALVPGSRRGVFAEESNGFLFHAQTGALPGFLVRFAYSPELGKGYLVLLNRGDASEALAEADTLLRGQLLSGDQLPSAVEAPAQARLDVSSLAGWYQDVSNVHPPEALYRSWLGFARAEPCAGGRLCVSSPGGFARLAAFDEERLRAQGRWWPGWQLRETERGPLLQTASGQWEPVTGWKVVRSVAAGILVSAGLLLGVALVPVWSWNLLRHRIHDYHELVPRLLPLAAVLCIVALQVMLFTTNYPELGKVSPPTIAILGLSVLAPLLGVVALLAALAGIPWKLPRRTVAVSLYLALTANAAVIAMAVHDLVAFQSWNY